MTSSISLCQLNWHKLSELTVCLYVVSSLEKEDFLESLHVLSCFVQLKSVLFNLLCVLDLITNDNIPDQLWPASVKFQNMWRHHSIQPLPCSLVSLWCTQQVQHSHTPRWWWRIWFKLLNETLKLSLISFSVINGSSLIRHCTLATFFSAATVKGWPQQS